MATSSMIRINPLSVAKGHRHTCELCSNTATLLCSSCRVTYYCSPSHMQTDAAGIHTKICSLLGALRSLRPTLGSEEERQKRQLTIAMSHHALIELCQNEAHKWAIKGRYDLCIPGALQALRFSLDVFGRSRIELVPAYLLLAEGNLGLGRLKAAEEFLLYANWAVLQSTTPAPPSTQSLLHRQFGALYSKQGRWDAARAAYAKDVYHAALEYGPEHIDTSVGVYHLGATFLASQPSNVEAALAFFDKVVDIWYRFLLHLRSHPAEQVGDYLLDHQVASSCTHLLHIVQVRHRQLGGKHIATAEAVYVLGLLKIAGGWDVDGEWLLTRAEAVYAEVLGVDNDSTQGIRRAREDMGSMCMQRGERMKDWELDEDAGPTSTSQPPAQEEKEAQGGEAGQVVQAPVPQAGEETAVGDAVQEVGATEVDGAAVPATRGNAADAHAPAGAEKVDAASDSSSTTTADSPADAAEVTGEAQSAAPAPATAPAEERKAEEVPAATEATVALTPSQAQSSTGQEPATPSTVEATTEAVSSPVPTEAVAPIEGTAESTSAVAEADVVSQVAAAGREETVEAVVVVKDRTGEVKQVEAEVEQAKEVRGAEEAAVEKAVEEQKEVSEQGQPLASVTPALIQPSALQ